MMIEFFFIEKKHQSRLKRKRIADNRISICVFFHKDLRFFFVQKMMPNDGDQKQVKQQQIDKNQSVSEHNRTEKKDSIKIDRLFAAAFFFL